MPIRMLPFRGLRFAASQDLQNTVSPPYDVISPELQSELMQRSASNAVWLDLNPGRMPDGSSAPSHDAAKKIMADWQHQGTLKADERPCYYLYSQQWQDNGQTIERKGVIGAILLDDAADAMADAHDASSATILPHERTIHQYIRERIELYAATNTNLSPIFLMGHDATRSIETELFDGEFSKKQTWQTVTDDDGVIHRFAAVSDGGAVELIMQVMVEQRLLIADGHHRFRTALTLKHQARKAWEKQHGSQPELGTLPTDYLMAFVTNMADPGLVVYPTHRILKGLPNGWSLERLLERIGVMFKDVDDKAFDKDATTIRLRTKHSSRVVKVQDPERFLSELPEALRQLDAAILDETIFKGLFHADAQDLKTGGLLAFERNQDAVEALMSPTGKGLVAFELHAPPMPMVKEICESGLLMPQKSTYFYPKLLTGLVMLPYGDCGAGKAAVSKAKPLPANVLPAGVALLEPPTPQPVVAH